MSGSDPGQRQEPAPERAASSHDPEDAQRFAVVVIGRNEGERLERSLRSVGLDSPRLLYVDSGSSDDSVELARRLASEVVVLEDTIPFTAARARNAGLERLLEIDASLQMVQFLDGDCEIEPGWLEAARAALHRDPSLGAVCGHLRERDPDASRYARLSQMEWVRPTGETHACGGIAMFRVAALNAVGGFDVSMIAGEEFELCYRLRQAGWKIERLDRAMAVHAGEMTTFRQWWLRAVRDGHAYAENATVQWGSDRKRAFRQMASILLWGLVGPLAALGGAAAALAWPRAVLLPLIVVCGYLALFARIHRTSRRHPEFARHAALYALFCVLAKFPYSVGTLRYWVGRARRRPSGLIEYKAVER